MSDETKTCETCETCSHWEPRTGACFAPGLFRLAPRLPTDRPAQPTDHVPRTSPDWWCGSWIPVGWLDEAMGAAALAEKEPT